MDLLLLRATPHVSIHYDQANDWLFVDWQSYLDLPAVALASLELARLFLRRPYPRVLISHAQVTGTNWNVPAWLAHEAIPHLVLAGLEQVAWVSGRSPRAQEVGRDVARRMPSLLITMFDDLESAVDWLRRTSATPTECRSLRLPTTEARLRLAVRSLTHLVLNQPLQLA